MSQDGQPLINLRPSTGQCSCGSGKVKRFGYPPTQVDQGRKVRQQGRTASTAKPKAWSIYHCQRSPRSPGAASARAVPGRCGGSVLKGGPRTACINCKSDNMINLTTKICTCGSDRQVRFPAGWWETGQNGSQCKSGHGRPDEEEGRGSDGALHAQFSRRWRAPPRRRGDGVLVRARARITHAIAPLRRWPRRPRWSRRGARGFSERRRGEPAPEEARDEGQRRLLVGRSGPCARLMRS